MKVIPLPNDVLVDQFKKGERTIGSIIVRDDNGTSRGVRPRWCRIYAVGVNVTDVKPGQWIYVKHGRWSRGAELPLNGDPEDLQTIWKVEYPESVMLVSDEEPEDNGFSINE